MNLPVNEIINKDWIEAAKDLPDNSVHCIITSPPYWGQRLYLFGTDKPCDGKKISHDFEYISDSIQRCRNCGGKAPILGLEKTPDEHIQKLVEGFRELRRVLRDDGTLWINYGDKYSSGRNGTRENESYGKKQGTSEGSLAARHVDVEDIDQGNLLGLAWDLAKALQRDGWILRSDIIWAKALSFCDKYSGSTMPESVNGWRWERCKKKVKEGTCARRGDKPALPNSGGQYTGLAQWKDCPGCAKCSPNAGYVLRKGSWRSTKAHEYLFQFAKKQGYFCDMEAVKEDANRTADVGWKDSDLQKYSCDPRLEQQGSYKEWRKYCPTGIVLSRNLRDVWVINPQPWSRAHYATFPEKLIEPIIKVATSQKGVCPKCGSPWARIVDSKQIKRERPNDRTDRHNQQGMNSCGNTVAGIETTTIGWRATCGCGCEETVPAIVYDPFIGSGTVAAVAAKLGRNYCGSELSTEYLDNQACLRIQEAETGISMVEIESGQMPLFKV